jgi:hypothetical protein
MKSAKKKYIEDVVPNLIREGKSPDEAISTASKLWEKSIALESEQALEVCYESSLEFTAEVTSTGFKTVLQEEDVLEDMTFAQAFAALKCEPGKRYEIEICVEEA